LLHGDEKKVILCNYTSDITVLPSAILSFFSFVEFLVSKPIWNFAFKKGQVDNIINKKKLINNKSKKPGEEIFRFFNGIRKYYNLNSSVN
jgi:hypothetical protein